MIFCNPYGSTDPPAVRLYFEPLTEEDSRRLHREMEQGELVA